MYTVVITRLCGIKISSKILKGGFRRCCKVESSLCEALLQLADCKHNEIGKTIDTLLKLNVHEICEV